MQHAVAGLRAAASRLCLFAVIDDTCIKVRCRAVESWSRVLDDAHSRVRICAYRQAHAQVSLGPCRVLIVSSAGLNAREREENGVLCRRCVRLRTLCARGQFPVLRPKTRNSDPRAARRDSGEALPLSDKICPRSDGTHKCNGIPRA